MIESFTRLHAAGAPLVLLNAWDAGSARAIERAGAPAIATSSWAVAAARGYDDGEALTFEELEDVTRRIAKSISVPLTVDIETGYSDDPAKVADNALRIRKTGAVGINIEDRDPKTASPVMIEDFTAKLRAIVRAQESKGEALFINSSAKGANPMVSLPAYAARLSSSRVVCVQSSSSCMASAVGAWGPCK